MRERNGRVPGAGAKGGILAIVLAGAGDKRLLRPTQRQAGPAVPFGGHYRTIDFTLSNCLNSGVRRIALVTEHTSQSLIRHIHQSWGFLRRELGEFIDIWPARQRLEQCPWGSEDVVYQSRDLIETHDPDLVLVLPGQHVYSMDYSRMLEEHVAKRADVTVACVEISVSGAGEFGIIGVDPGGRVRSFEEKPGQPRSPGEHEISLGPIGVYVFDRACLLERMNRDPDCERHPHDFGSRLLRAAIDDSRVFAYDFRDRHDPALPGYWRGVGTIESFWQAHMDLLDEPPKLDLYDESWPIWAERSRHAPARIASRVRISASILAPGCVVSGDVYRSVVSTGCRISPRSRVSECVLLPGATVGENCVLDRVVVDSRCRIPDNTVIGATLIDESETAYRSSPSGVVLVPQGGRARQGHAAALMVA